MKELLIIGILFLGSMLNGQYTFTCVDESNNESVICSSCDDFTIGVSKGILIESATSDKFVFSPVKAEIRLDGRVVLVGPHEDERAAIIPISQTNYNTEALMKAFLEGCGSVVDSDDQEISEFVLNGTELVIEIEDGNRDTVQLSSLIVANTDDQAIQTFSFNSGDQSLTLTLEDGGTSAASLSSLLQSLNVSGNNLSLSNSNTVDLSFLLDNTDNQIIDSLSFQNGVLTIGLEDGNLRNINISQVEADPLFSASPFSTLTQTDIDNWNNDLVDDADNDPFNEIDSIQVGQTRGFDFTIEGDQVNGGRKQVLEILLDSTIQVLGFNANGGTDDQILSFDGNTDILSLEDGGNPISLAKYNNSNVSCTEVTNVTSSSLDLSSLGSPITLPSEQSKRSIELNGQPMYEGFALTRIWFISISSNTITFYENLESDDIITVCLFGE